MIETAASLGVEPDLSEWGVLCGITGAPIRLPDLLYWNVAKQIAYSGPEVIPENQL